MRTERVRITLVEDHALLADSLHVTLSAEGFEVVTVAVPQLNDGARSLLGPILASHPGVVLLDLDLGPAGDATSLVSPLAQAGCVVIVVTASTEHLRWGECLAHGAHGVLPKASSLDQIVAAVRCVSNGRVVMPEAHRLELVQRWYRHRSDDQGLRARLDRLTRRESEVLGALSAGKRVREIAIESFVSEATVRTQVKSILAKLRVTSQIAAVAMARDAR
ncbi:MAG: LuxR C-terminal-related transcriptional regulator [Nocardioidaceae bacterium]